MSTLRVDNIQLNQEGNASISIANSYNVVFTTDGIERVKISKDGFNLAGTGALKVPTGNTAVRPAVPEPGQVRYNTTTGKFEGYGSKWAAIGSGAEIGDAAPSNSGSGDLWWNSSDGKMYIYYVDANSSQWVDISAGTGGQYLPLTGGNVSGNVAVSSNLSVGTTWFNSGARILYQGSFDASAIGSRPGLLGTGSYGGGVGFLDGTRVAGLYTQNTGGDLVFFTGQSTTDAPNTKEKARIDANGNFYMNSGYGSVSLSYGCRAWVNFNGTGTVSINGAGNVSSISDNGVGKYTVNFAASLTDGNYSTTFAGADAFFGSVVTIAFNSVYSASQCGIRTASNSSSPADADVGPICLAFFR